MAKPLDRYRAKRDFTASPEPEGRAAATAFEGRFCVQKHDARRLHYDLRLELDGVLKSWAVTRGPSLVPGEKRLSVHTEDHPIDYLTWEGVIPKGQYGGGTMIVWDQGTWTPHGDVHRAYAKGHLEFTLAGERLQGRWHLVRIKGRGEKAQPWLLIKSDDEAARGPGDPDILEEATASVISGRTNRDLARDGTARPDHAARESVAGGAKGKARTGRPSTRVAGARKAVLPPFVPPALATLAAKAPTGAGWIYEIKLDGYRVQARLDGGRVTLLTRSGLDWTAKFPAISEALGALALPSALLDGEIVAEDEGGVSRFSALQEAIAAERTDALSYHVFDLLYLDGQDLHDVPLLRRKELLRLAFGDRPPGGRLRVGEHGEAMARHACRLGLEGIVAKRADAPYRSGRSETWRKIKCTRAEDFVVAGYTPSSGTPRAIGSLILGIHEPDGLVHVGRVGTGFGTAMARRLHGLLDPIRRTSSPFVRRLTPEASRDARFVEPRLVAEVEFRAWTGEGLLRHASFKGLREDRMAEEITRQIPRRPPAEEAAGAAGAKRSASTKRTASAKRAKRAAPALPEVRLTHPDRVLWPDIGLTKQGLAEFYAGIADRILPHIVGRPLSLVRCPGGTGETCFFQKHAFAGMDARVVERVRVGEDDALAIRSLEGLVALVQASVLEIHPWGSTLEAPETPDRLILDLDPGEGVTWESMVAAADDVRARLAAAGLSAFVKTTGGKGLHVVAPLVPGAGWEAVKTYAGDLAAALAREAPERFVARMTKSVRAGRIYLDFLRNGRGATAVAAFSTRARAGAPVSTPVAWEDLPALGSAARFRVDNLSGRLDALAADPWEEFAHAARPLPEKAKRAPSRRRT